MDDELGYHWNINADILINHVYIYISKLRVCELHNRYVLGGDFSLALWDVIGIHAW